MNDLTVLFPAYNEAERIGPAIASAVAFFQDYKNKIEIMVVENGSTDGTYVLAGLAFAEAIKSYGCLANNLNFVALRSKKGKGAAIKYGAARANGKYILITDVDLATPISQVGKLLAAEADLAVGSRRLPGSDVNGLGIARRVTSAVFSLLARPLTPQVKDTQCGFKLIRAEAARKLMPLITLDGYAFDVELIQAALVNGMRVAEVPVIWRHNDQSKVNPFIDSIDMAADLARIAANRLNGSYAL